MGTVKVVDQDQVQIMNELGKSIANTTKESLKLLDAINQLIKANDGLGNSTEGNEPKKKKLTELEKEENRIKQALAKNEAKLSLARTEAAKKLAASKVELQKANKELKNNAIEAKRSVLATEALKGSYNAISASLSANLIKWKKLTAEERNNSAEGKRLTATIKKQRAELERLDKTTGNASRGVAKYKEGIISATKSLIGAFGLTVGLAAAVKVMGSAIKTSIQFEATMSKVKAVSGASQQEFNALRDQAKLLGEQTQRTATDAARLQVELSKLGFDPTQILQSTDAILSLSLAAGEDLAQSAKVAAGNIKAFNLDAKESTRVADVMAKSFASSALDLSKFETASAIAAPTLSSFGVSIEETTAKLSVLVDRNIDASTAGTGLRNIYLDLTRHGITYEEALDKINNSSDQAGTAFELFGKRGATVALVLAQNQKEADRLTKVYEKAEGSAKRMAKIMADNLAGDTDIANSAMQGFALNLVDKLTPSLRSATQGFTRIVSAVSEYIKIPVSEKIMEEQKEVNSLAVQLTNTNLKEDDRLTLLTKLESISPDLVKGIDAENLSVETLRKNLAKYNEQAANRIVLANLSKEEEEKLTKLGETRAKRLESEARQLDIIAKIDEDLAFGKGTVAEKTAEALKLLEKEGASYDDFINKADVTVNRMGVINDFRSEEQKLFDSLINVRSFSNRQIEEENKNLSDVEAFQKRASAIKDLLGLNKELVDSSKKTNESTNESHLDANEELTKEEQKAFNKRKKEEQKAAAEFGKIISDNQYREEKNRLDASKQFESDSVKATKSAADKKAFIAKREAEERIALQEMIKDASVDLAAQSATAITDILFEASSQRRDEELERLSEQRDEDLERVDAETEEDLAAEDAKVEAGILTEEEAEARKRQIQKASDAEKARIEEEADRREAAIKTKQARSEKIASLADVAINTAVSISKAFAQLGPIAAAPFIPFLVAQGAIQTAAILATPIPKFEKGTDGKYSTPNTWIGGEKGSEMVLSPSGEMFLTPDTPTLFQDMPNHMVIPHKETQQRLADMAVSGRSMGFNDGGIRSDLRAIKKAISSQSTTTEKDGVRYSRKNNRRRRDHLSFLEKMKA